MPLKPRVGGGSRLWTRQEKCLGMGTIPERARSREAHDRGRFPRGLSKDQRGKEAGIVQPKKAMMKEGTMSCLVHMRVRTVRFVNLLDNIRIDLPYEPIYQALREPHDILGEGLGSVAVCSHTRRAAGSRQTQIAEWRRDNTEHSIHLVLRE